MQAMPQHDKADGHSTCRHTGIDAGRALVAAINNWRNDMKILLLLTILLSGCVYNPTDQQRAMMFQMGQQVLTPPVIQPTMMRPLQGTICRYDPYAKVTRCQ